MSDPFARAVTSTFARHGIAAVLDPDGAAVAVRLLPFRPDDIESYGSVRIQQETGLFEIRIGDFAGYGDGAVLEIAGERRVVQHHEVRDPRRLKVMIDTVLDTGVP